MKINSEKRKQILDGYCKAELMLQNLKNIVQNEIELSDDNICEHFSKSQDLSDLIMDLYSEVKDNCEEDLYENKVKTKNTKLLEDTYEYKILWLEELGFKEIYDKDLKCKCWAYDIYRWTKEEIEKRPLKLIKYFKKYYDDLISEEELRNYEENGIIPEERKWSLQGIGIGGFAIIPNK